MKIKTIENRVGGTDVEMNYVHVMEPDYTVASCTVVEKAHTDGKIHKFVQLILYDKISDTAIEKEVLVERK